MSNGIKFLAVAIALAFAGSAQAALAPYRNAVLADNPFVYYEFEEAAGAGVATDSSGNANHGTYTGTVTLGGTEVGAPVGIQNAGQFSAANSYVDVPNLGTNHANLTVEMWVNADGIAGGCCTSLYSTDVWGNGPGGHTLHYNVKGGRDIEHALNSGAPNNINSPGGTILDDTWYHVVTTYNGVTGLVEFYVDGAFLSSGTHTALGDVDLSSTGQITAWNNGRNLPGHVDEFAFYDSVLTANQIRAHYDAAFQTGGGGGGGNDVPEPATAMLGLIGLGALAARRSRRQS